MSRGLKVFLSVSAVFAVLAVAGVSYAAVTLVRAGGISVDVDQPSEGNHVAVWVPAGLVELVVPLIPSGVIPPEAAAEVRPWLPLTRGLCDELSRLPDTVFVSVSSRDEQVEVSKRGGYLVVEVRDGADHVSVRVPLRTMRAALRLLERAA